MTEQPLFCETLSEALKEAVKACGGAKAIARRLWPEKSVEAAQTRLLDCLNDARPDKLSPEQVLLILKLAREAGSHVAMAFLCTEAGYEAPRPASAEAQARTLVDVIAQQQHDLAFAVARLEKLMQGNPTLLRAVV